MKPKPARANAEESRARMRHEKNTFLENIAFEEEEGRGSFNRWKRLKVKDDLRGDNKIPWMNRCWPIEGIGKPREEEEEEEEQDPSVCVHLNPNCRSPLVGRDGVR